MNSPSRDARETLRQETDSNMNEPIGVSRGFQDIPETSVWGLINLPR
ncbi:hypothetical protein [Rhodopirellula sallentina]|uniref:Uncharacterized protein n=1 Tax=Rhodopirellula sallentina SM41 TaxID=1263870 RepID=M5U6Y0_9BACT|nr:hypothetical protein [Rhodopirellula sallentina]EMI57222.1 hypothetical protein RSSM_01328 [Rhodopirellula sallentina SM41]